MPVIRAIQTDRCRPYLAHPSEAPVPPMSGLGPLGLHDGALKDIYRTAGLRTRHGYLPVLTGRTA
jgi:hypothetical protein